MSRLSITKEFSWDMAHVLEGHLGLCKNLHGHTYKMEVAVKSLHKTLPREGPAAGMVMDFKELKDIVKKIIVEPSDHATMINTKSLDPFEIDLTTILEKHGKKIVYVPYRPTAENMALDFIQALNYQATYHNLDWRVVSIKLWETPTSYAEVKADE